MEPATESRRAGTISALSAGLQAGMLGGCWMLVWLGISSEWRRRSFWTAENLMASVFYGDAAIHSGFSLRTLSGMALYLLLYSTLGAFFAFAVRDRLPPGARGSFERCFHFPGITCLLGWFGNP